MLKEDLKAGMIMEVKDTAPFMKYPYLLVESVDIEFVQNPDNTYSDYVEGTVRGSKDGEHWTYVFPCSSHVVCEFYEFLQYEKDRQPIPETSRLADVE